MAKLQTNQKGAVERVIDSATYEFFPWGVRKTLDVFAQLLDVGGEALGQLVGLAGKGPKTEVGAGSIAGMVVSLSAGINKDRAVALNLIELLVTDSVSRNAAAVDFERDFDGDFMHLKNVLTTALVVRFGRFFGEAATTLSTTAPSPQN